MAFFITLTTNEICKHILSAKDSVVLAAPAINDAIAKALIQTHQRLGNEAVQVILDVSADVCRIGYGDISAVRLLHEAGLQVREEKALRLGVLICDNKGWSFVATPRLVEAEVDEVATYNALTLTEMQVVVLRGELPKTAEEEAQDRQVPEEQDLFSSKIGAKLVKKEQIQEVEKALIIAPPQPFDLARQSNVYSSLIRYVELSFEGLNVAAKTIKLPKEISLLTTKDKELKSLISTSLKLIGKTDQLKELQEIADGISALREAFLPSVGKEGRIILKEKEPLFEEKLASINALLDTAKEKTKNTLEKQLEKTRKQILPDLVAAVLKNPPSKFEGLFSLNKDGATEYVNQILNRVFPSADSLISGMKIHCAYKDITYNSLKNKEFMDRVNEVLPDSILDKALLQEWVAADARE